MNDEIKRKPGSPPKVRQEAKLLPVKLTKNYVPKGDFEPVDMVKAPLAGVGFTNKIWAGSTIKLPADEAKSLVARNIADRADEFG